MHQLEIIEVGDELGFIFPDEIVAALNLKIDSSILVEFDERGIRIVASLPMAYK
jgi:antitoxin component of MazEF toxin-antitoxin module